MRRRLEKDATSVTKATHMQLGIWTKYSLSSPEFRPLQQVFSEVHKCSGSALAGNSSDCYQMAQLAASMGAKMLAGCTIRAVQSVSSDHTTHLEDAIEGHCIDHNYPPVCYARHDMHSVKPNTQHAWRF